MINNKRAPKNVIVVSKVSKPERLKFPMLMNVIAEALQVNKILSYLNCRYIQIIIPILKV